MEIRETVAVFRERKNTTNQKKGTHDRESYKLDREKKKCKQGCWKGLKLTNGKFEFGNKIRHF